MEQTATYVTVPAGSVKRSVSIGVPGIQVTASLTHQIPHYIQMTLPGTSRSYVRIATVFNAILFRACVNPTAIKGGGRLDLLDCCAGRLCRNSPMIITDVGKVYLCY